MNLLNILLLTLIIILIILCSYKILKTCNCKIENYVSPRYSVRYRPNRSNVQYRPDRSPPYNIRYRPSKTPSPTKPVIPSYIKVKTPPSTKPVIPPSKPERPPSTKPVMPPSKTNRPSWMIRRSYKPTKKICTCPGGIAATGEGCSKRGTIDCTKCNEGYVLRKICEKDITQTHRYVIDHGPTFEYSKEWKKCPAGMTFKDSRCRPTRCVCEGGWAAIGINCPKYGDHKCLGCRPSKKLVNGKCIDQNKEIKNINDTTEDIIEDEDEDENEDEDIFGDIDENINEDIFEDI